MTKYHNGTVTWQEYVDQGGDPEKLDSPDFPDYTNNADKQTSITIYGDDRTHWEIATTDVVVMNRILKAGWTPEPDSYMNGPITFKIPYGRLSFLRPVTDADRARGFALNKRATTPG